MKALPIITLLLLCASAIGAQTSNVHAAISIGGTSNLGFRNPQIGASSGLDYHHKQIVLSGDLRIDKIEKVSGGRGFQISGRETIRLFKDKFFVQCGANEARYKVRLYSKSTIEPLVGIGYADRNFVAQANYLKDVSSFNHQNVIEGSVTFYLQHHVYVKGSVAADHFKSNKTWVNGSAARIEIGVWK